MTVEPMRDPVRDCQPAAGFEVTGLPRHPGPPDELATNRLIDYLDALSGCVDEDAAVAVGLEFAAAAVEAEIALLIRAGQCVASRGAAEAVAAQLVSAAPGRAPTAVVLPGFGGGSAVTVALGAAWDGELILVRLGDVPFSGGELSLLRGVATALRMSCESVRLLAAERLAREASQERQTLMERLSKIQRSISHRAGLQEVLDSITTAAADLLGDEVSTLRTIDPADSEWMIHASSFGIPDEIMAQALRTPVGDGVGGLALREDRLVVVEDDTNSASELAAIRPMGLTAVMAAPVHEQGEPVGCLLVASRKPGRRYSGAEREALAAFAEHVSLALTDARTVAAMENAYRDSLTGLANRTLFLERLESVASHNRREGNRFALLYLDVDGFKIINDSLGHAAGDALLVQIGERIRACLRSGDYAGRLGGDEFAVLVETGARTDSAAALARRLLDIFDTPFEVERNRVVVRASVGVAISGNGAHSGHELLRNADVAMYRAKAEGKGRFVVFEERMYAAAVDRLELESDLRRCIENRQLRVHFQPIVDVATGRIRGAEALVRWQHPTRGLVAPLDFVPVAEETGLINDIERWVLQESLRTLRFLQPRSPMARPLSVSVNLSGVRLRDGDVVGEVREALELSGVPAECLTLEVTESVLLKHTDATVQALRSLKEMGVRLAIDDFGAGYSSLTYLTMCDFDILKMDRAFIHSALGEAGKAPVARAILAMARVLQLEVVAEGVETVNQLRLLQDMGCLHAQGDHFSPPLTEEELGELLRRQWTAHREATLVPQPLADAS